MNIEIDYFGQKLLDKIVKRFQEQTDMDAPIRQRRDKYVVFLKNEIQYYEESIVTLQKSIAESLSPQQEKAIEEEEVV